MKSENKDKLIDILPRGELNALHLEELSNLLICTPADVKQQIKKARMQGVPIISSNNGYWIAESTQEISEFCSRMMRGAFSRLETVAKFKVYLKKYDGQLEFDSDQNVNKDSDQDEEGKELKIIKEGKKDEVK